ncbi:MAG TPA: SMP-30/gluconolactonase/LRE family protein [Candidatus Binatia bacterium]|nr:SMP-30/gluconolactonase/LRE family protein [Candidatus Binatia bacterium]
MRLWIAFLAGPLLAAPVGFAVAGSPTGARIARAPHDVLAGTPDAIVDLRTESGANLAHARWRWREAAVVPADFRAAGADSRPSGAPVRTLDVDPHAGRPEPDGDGWQDVPPGELEVRRGSGLLAFGWYRVDVTMPERFGGVATAGASVVFEVVCDDYAEVWVDGRLPAIPGQAGGGPVAGWNAPSRVLLTSDARPGQTFRIAVFAANAPLSDPPHNFVWLRSATLDVYAGDRARITERFPAEVSHRAPELDAILAPDATVERIADGFVFTEGPVWDREGGFLLFSAPNENTIYRWMPSGVVYVHRPKSGYTGLDAGEYTQPGSNGLTFDREGRLTIAEMGNRRITRIEKNGAVTVLADRFGGKRFNSPNDLVYRSDGAIYFTDPDFGLPRFSADPRKELPYAGVFRAKDGAVQLLTTDLRGPNGIAFSPDERFLYVGNWDPERKVVMRYPVHEDGTLGPGAVFFDMTSAPGEAAIDGLKVDRLGHLWVAGPGGVWILSPDAQLLGVLAAFPEEQHNLAWGDADGRTLYMTALTGVYRIRTEVAGVLP